MFGLLKNKIAGFINGLTGREEKKPTGKLPLQGEEAAAAGEKEQPKQEKGIAKPEQAAPAGKAQHMQEPPAPVSAKENEPKKEQAAPEKPGMAPSSVSKEAQQAKQLQPKPEIAHEKQQIFRPAAEKKQTVSPAHKAEEPPDLSGLERKAGSEKRSMAPKLGLGSAIKSFFSSEITIGESDVSDLVEELELSLLEADVEYGVSMEVAAQLRGRLVGMKVPKGEVAKKTREAIAQVLESIMDSGNKFDFVSRVQGLARPAKILFVGPNGAGKTTTMAKVAQKLREAGMSSVFSASDTFRAAAIEQTEVHGERLGVKVIKSKYGADPASVAFDAINFARSHNIDAVLIDSAGRQDTNANLLSELKKINRVAQPDLKIYVGESIGGNALIDQIRAFHEAIGVDGAILTKLDCDAKGGTAISIAKATGIPVLFLGVGQRYEDLIPFDPRRIVQEIMN